MVHFGTERERLEAEATKAQREQDAVDFEIVLKNYPTKFKISEC